MTGLELTMLFLKGDKVDHPPFHPIIMRWAAKYAGIPYSEFCTIPHQKCEAMIKCAKDFDIDWVTVMSDPWAEASAFGIEVEYPENDLPIDKSGHLKEENIQDLKPFRVNDHQRTRCRIEEIREFKQRVGNELFIVGWVEGPVAEYVDLRHATEASLDFLMHPESVHIAMDVITQCALDFITLQIDAGAHCIGVGDAFCSQIGSDLYRQFAFDRQKAMVQHIHKKGAIAKLHICGNTEAILPDMIKTGADIVDIDHLVPSLANYLSLLGTNQVLCGKADPVSIIQDGTSAQIEESVQLYHKETKGRCIVSAGCEITPGTTVDNMHAFYNAALKL